MKDPVHKLVGPLDPVLGQKAEVVRHYDDIRAYVESMERVLRLSPNGVGLAAPQIGLSKRLICWAPELCCNVGIRRTTDIAFMVNPLMIPNLDAGQELGPEACLSFPGYTASVLRFKTILVEYLDLDGHAESMILHGFQARVIQHEIDHLNGICPVKEPWRKDRLKAAQMGKLPGINTFRPKYGTDSIR